MTRVLEQISGFLEDSRSVSDPVLTQKCYEAHKHEDERIRLEEMLLANALQKLRTRRIVKHKSNKDKSNIPAIIEIFRAQYNDIQPQDPALPEVSPVERLDQEPSSWALFKASALYPLFHVECSQGIIFQLAGMELAYIKADSKRRRLVTTDVYSCMKLRKRKRKVEPGLEADGAGQGDGDAIMVGNDVDAGGDSSSGGGRSSEEEVDEFRDAVETMDVDGYY